MRWLILLIPVVMTAAGCAPGCDPAACPCCRNDVCYLGGCGDDGGACTGLGSTCAAGGLRCCAGTTCQPVLGGVPNALECRP